MNQHDLWKAIQGGKPRVHATGFAQLYLCEGVRLHVWNDELISLAPDIRQAAFYHDHRYGIKSRVLRGMLLDTPALLYGKGNDIEEQTRNMWDIFEVRPAHEGDAEKPHLATAGHWVEALQPRVVSAGECYLIDKRSFHQTRHLAPTVTVMRKMEEEETWARLLVPRGFDPIHSLQSQPDQSRLKRIMWTEAQQVGPEGLAQIEEMMTEAHRAY